MNDNLDHLEISLLPQRVGKKPDLSSAEGVVQAGHDEPAANLGTPACQTAKRMGSTTSQPARKSHICDTLQRRKPLTAPAVWAP